MTPTINRRRFLTITCGSLGAVALACCGLSVAASTVQTEQPDVEMIESHYGREDVMNQKILVAYASQAGSTGGVADAIGKVFAGQGAVVDVRPIAKDTDLSPYHAVVVGSAIHGGAWMPEAVQFVQDHRTELAQKPFAAFLVCMTLTMKNETYRKGVADFLEPVRKIVRPVSEGTFAGALDFSKLPAFPERLILRAIVASGAWKAGDYRDWQAIQAWAESTGSLLL